MKNINWKKCSLFCMILFLFIGIGLLHTETAHAAENPITMKSCKLNSSGKKLTIKAKVKKKTKDMGNRLYLLSLDAHTSESGKKKAKPLAKVKTKKGTITYKVKYDSSMLYQKFVVAGKKGSKYKILSNAMYITNPEVLATYTGTGPKAASKKGLQVEELSDSLEIGTKHAVINWTLNSLLNNDAIRKMEYVYKGKTYYLDADQIKRNDELVQAYNAAGVRVTIILLLPKDNASTGTKAMQFGGYPSTKFSSVNTGTKAGAQTFEAVMTYLAEHYGTKENLVTGWILGNEINAPYIWNYGANKKLSTYIQNYARSFRICYNAVKSVNKNANVYVSLDYNWNRDFDSGNRYFSAKAVLDSFYQQIKAQGNIVFQIAYHSYPQDLGDAIFWDDSLATNSTSSKIINFKNLQVLTKYVKKNFGKKYKIMLSEQSFNSSRGEVVQAAAYAYAYYMSEGNDMIEAFIYGREFDHPEEMKEGYYWGLCDVWHVKRLVWSVFQYIDTKDSFTFTDPLLSSTGLSSWSKISGFKKSKYTKMADIKNNGKITEVIPISATSAKIQWEKMNTGDGYEIFRNGEVIASVSGNSTVSYTDKGLTPGAVYQYQVRMYKDAPVKENANNRMRIYGGLSGVAEYKAIPGQIELNTEKCEIAGNTIKVVWKKMDGVTGYEVLRSTAIDGEYLPVAVKEQSKYTYKDTDVVSGMKYFYKIRGYVIVDGETLYGETSEAYTAQPLIQLTAEVADGKVVLSWTQWLSEMRYRVYCKSAEDTSFKKLEEVTELSYTCTRYKDASKNWLDLEPGKTYCFRVRVEYADGTADKQSNTVEVTIPQVTVPEGTTPEGTTPEQTTPEGTTPEGTTPEQTTPEQTTPEGTTSEETTPEQTTPEETTPEETIPEGTTPEEATEKETISAQTISENI